MPSQTTLIEIKQGLAFKAVQENLAAYAIGLLVYEQNKYKKVLDKKQKTVDVDLGFYYTMQLLDQLAQSHPHEAKKMMEAIMSFDSIGRYLLSEQEIYLDGVLFELDKVLNQYGVDTDRLKITARKNQANAFCISEPEQQEDVIMAPAAFALPEDLGVLGKDTAVMLRRLATREKIVRENVVLHKKIVQFSMHFDLLSQRPTHENVKECLLVLAELFQRVFQGFIIIVINGYSVTKFKPIK
ncbi:hypothetical protein [Legionella nagasakiensis]|uniref:hypothetical protein n=1 Tax=Legionella nagasakiensis TaxID=535290 RepID=UPI0010567CB4|nr:hypothetical protein [Legionella nagasakiensis]